MIFDNHIARRKEKDRTGPPGLEWKELFCYAVPRGRVLRKEDKPMKHFLRDILAMVLAGILVAAAVRLLTL